MSAEFITLNSKLTIDQGTLIEKKLTVNTEEGFTRLIAFIALLAFLAYCIYRIVVDKKYFFIIQLLLVMIWLAPHFKRLQTFLFVETWKSSIRMDYIQRVTSSKLQNGLETQVTLHLKNRRKKFLTFRDAENQVDDFVRVIETKEIALASMTT